MTVDNRLILNVVFLWAGTPRATFSAGLPERAGENAHSSLLCLGEWMRRGRVFLSSPCWLTRSQGCLIAHCFRTVQHRWRPKKLHPRYARHFGPRHLASSVALDLSPLRDTTSSARAFFFAVVDESVSRLGAHGAATFAVTSYFSLQEGVVLHVVW